jgi:hypothetical protein
MNNIAEITESLRKLDGDIPMAIEDIITNLGGESRPDVKRNVKMLR